MYIACLSIAPDEFCSLPKHFSLKINSFENTSIITNTVAKITILDHAMFEEDNVLQGRILHSASVSEDDASFASRVLQCRFLARENVFSDQRSSRFPICLEGADIEPGIRKEERVDRNVPTQEFLEDAADIVRMRFRVFHEDGESGAGEEGAAC